MALIHLWRKDKSELAAKHIQQVITFAGDGKLGDASGASEELREYLRNVPSDLIITYANQCLQDSFSLSGFALQDLVNEIGRRLDFNVTHGRYRGTSKQPGFDGIWSDSDRHSIVVEVKTTDAYRIDLDTISGYRIALAHSKQITLERSSMLIVVGRQDTGDLEAQIRGSRHAWDMRIISVEALSRMLKLKEELDDPAIISRIHEILIPREFTKLDPIVEIAFSAVLDAKESDEVLGESDAESGKKFTPVAFHESCIARIENKLKVSLIKQTRASFSSPDKAVRVLCAVSRLHERGKRFWFAFHPHQAEFLEAAHSSFVAFGCGDADTLFLIPYDEFKPWLEYFNRTDKGDRFYWHVVIREDHKKFLITGRSGTKEIDITRLRL